MKYSTSQFPKAHTSELPLIDALIKDAGYSSIHYTTLLFTSLILFLDGIHVLLLQSTYIPLQNYFALTDYEMSLISSSMFLSIGLGSFLTTFDFVNKKRRQSLILYTFLIFIFTFLLCLLPYLFFFILFRCFVGICMGIVIPLICNLLCEILPVKNRSFLLVSCGSFFNLGVIFLNSVMLLLMPNFEKEKLYKVFFVMSLPALFISIAMFYYLEESPRYLILNDRSSEGFEVLERMVKIKLRKLNRNQKEIIKAQVKEGNNKQVDKRIKSLFSNKFWKISLILMILLIINAFLANGGAIVMSLALKHIQGIIHPNMSKLIISNTEVIKSQILIFLISFPGCLIAGVMSEMKILGRKRTILIGFLLVAFFSFIGILNLNYFSFFIGMASLSISISLSVTNAYACEIYPTKIRDLALGFLFSCTRIAGLLSQFIAILIFKINFLGHYYVSIVLCMIACIYTYLLPYDTLGIPLDVDVENDKDINCDNDSILENTEVEI